MCVQRYKQRCLERGLMLQLIPEVVQITYHGQKLRKMCCGHTGTEHGQHEEQGWCPTCRMNNAMLDVKSSISCLLGHARQQLEVKGSLTTQMTPKVRPTMLSFYLYPEIQLGKEV